MTSKLNLAIILTVCLTEVLSLQQPIAAQPSSTSTTTKTVTTKSAALSKPTITTTTTHVVAKSAPHLKKRKAIKSKKRNTTIVHTSTSLTGGVAKKHKHRAHSLRLEKSGTAQQKRSAKLNAFLKNPPRMKKAPYTNPPGLDVPSSPAL